MEGHDLMIVAVAVTNDGRQAVCGPLLGAKIVDTKPECVLQFVIKDLRSDLQ